MRVRIPPPAPAAAASAAVFAIAALVLAWLSSRVRDWAVMTDELLYERLALSIAESGVPLPRVHGEIVDVYALLYPLLTAPVYALVELPEAVRGVHALNGVLFASAAIPAFLLARELRLPAYAQYASSVFAVAVPWTVIGAFVMTEAAAYPAFLWAAVALQRAVAEPSPRRDAVALGAVAVATLARPQLAILALVLVAAAAAQELRHGRWREHRLLLAAALVAVALAALAGTRLLGSYAPALAEGALLSTESLRSAVVHVNVTAVAIGLVPLLLGGAWAVAALVRPPEPGRLAFAALAVASTVLLALQSASVVTRFGLGIDIKDRYFFYVAPLLFLATACALDDPRRRSAAVLAATGAFVLTIGLTRFEPVFGVNLDSPASTTHEALIRLGFRTGLDPADLLAIAGGTLGAVVFFAVRRVPRRPLALATLGFTLAAVSAHTVYTWDRLLGSSGPAARALTAAPSPERAWIDRVAADGSSVAMLPLALGEEWYPSAIAWWDVEFWNRRVDRAYLVEDMFTYTPETFPRASVEVDSRSGAIAGVEPPDYVVRTPLDTRFRPAGTAIAAGSGLELVEVALPFRAAWVTTGLHADGWTDPARSGLLRVFEPEGAIVVRLTLAAPEMDAPRAFTVGPLTGELDANESRQLELEVCVPAGGHADVPIATEGASSVREIPTAPPYAESFRSVGVRVSAIETLETGLPC